MWNVHCLVCSVHCTHYVVCSVLIMGPDSVMVTVSQGLGDVCIPGPGWRPGITTHSTLPTPQVTIHTQHSTGNTLNSTLYRSQSTCTIRCKGHVVQYTLHSAQCPVSVKLQSSMSAKAQPAQTAPLKTVSRPAKASSHCQLLHWIVSRYVCSV